MQGKIIKGIAGFYYVHVSKGSVYECKAKGIFRRQKIKPLVGDNVRIDIISEEDREGNIIEILERKNELIRPAVANVDQALVLFAAAKPAPNFNLLDRFLIMMDRQNVETMICFNKADIVSESDRKALKTVYENSGYPVSFISVKENRGTEELKKSLEGKITVLAGPSGVGKSSLMNLLNPEANMETGSISKKIERGKHTTRHSEFVCIEDGTFVLDTPGFSSIYIGDFEKEKLKDYYREFCQYEEACRFQGCVHINEPDCRVKEALEAGKISRIRYENYKLLFEELKNMRRY